MNNRRALHEELEELRECFNRLECAIVQEQPFKGILWLIDRFATRRRACICMLISECALTLVLMIVCGVIQ